MTLDDIRSTLFAAALRQLLADTLQPSERVLWQGQPDGLAIMRMWRFLWWAGVPWLALTVLVIWLGGIGEFAMFFVLIGAMMVTAPVVMLLQDLQTLFVITDRRALILRTAWGRRQATGTAFKAMDAELETLDIGRGVGHLNFASRVSARSPDADYTGRYGFRCVRDPVRVGEILDRARGERRPT